MRTKEELIVIKNFLKECIEREKTIREDLVKEVYLAFPEKVADRIIYKIEFGEDPLPLVYGYVRWRFDQDDDFGKVILIE